MLDSPVWIDTSFGPFPAKVDPSHRWNNYLQPRFTLDTVREIAARSQEVAAKSGHANDTVHVIDGGTRDGKPMAVVVFVTWPHFDDNPAEITDVVPPDSDGLYAIGGGTWTFAPWTCPCGFAMDWHLPHCPDCGTHRDHQPPYRLPDAATISTAAHAAVSAHQTSGEALGRVMAVVTAAAVRDVLTDHDDSAPFDAARLELVEGTDGSLFATGRYWTTAGAERTFAAALGEADASGALHDMNEWVAHLDDSNHHVWRPLCTALADRDGHSVFSLDLAAAAQLPTD